MREMWQTPFVGWQATVLRMHVKTKTTKQQKEIRL
nr:MAG TPA: hypothetical protein [Caudoviricetes sp.]